MESGLHTYSTSKHGRPTFLIHSIKADALEVFAKNWRPGLVLGSAVGGIFGCWLVDGEFRGRLVGVGFSLRCRGMVAILWGGKILICLASVPGVSDVNQFLGCCPRA